MSDGQVDLKDVPFGSWVELPSAGELAEMQRGVWEGQKKKYPETSVEKNLKQVEKYYQGYLKSGQKAFLLSFGDNPFSKGYYTATFALGGKNAFNMMYKHEQTLKVRVLDGEAMQVAKMLEQDMGHRSCMSGCDPEVFVVDGKGELIPAWKILQRKIERGEAEQQFWDGFQAEFTTQAGHCLQTLSGNIRRGLSIVLDAARAIDPKANLTKRSVLMIPREVLETEDATYVALGCTPSENIYGSKGLPVPDPRQLPWRFAGGHCHWSVEKQWQTKERLAPAIKALDVVLGIPSVALFGDWDDPLRRKFYGRAGEYRLPKYGIEYRVLSNAWLFHSVAYHMVFELGRVGLRYGLLGLRKEFDIPDEKVMEVINECDVKGALALMDGPMEKLYKACVYKASCTHEAITGNAPTRMMWKALHEGIQSVVEIKDDVLANWSAGEQQKDWGNMYPLELGRHALQYKGSLPAWK